MSRVSIEAITEMLENINDKKKTKITEIILLLIPASDHVLDIVHKTVIAMIKYKK